VREAGETVATVAQIARNCAALRIASVQVNSC
jgi:hypothetical protein